MRFVHALAVAYALLWPGGGGSESARVCTREWFIRRVAVSKRKPHFSHCFPLYSAATAAGWSWWHAASGRRVACPLRRCRCRRRWRWRWRRSSAPRGCLSRSPCWLPGACGGSGRGDAHGLSASRFRFAARARPGSGGGGGHERRRGSRTRAGCCSETRRRCSFACISAMSLFCVMSSTFSRRSKLSTSLRTANGRRASIPPQITDLTRYGEIVYQSERRC